MAPNEGIARFCHFIVLFTNRLAMRFLHTPVPLNFILCLRASLWTGLQTHKHIMLQYFLGRIRFLRMGMGLWGGLGTGMGNRGF